MRRRYWILLGVLAVAVVAAGSAIAATKLESPSSQSQAIIKDAAGRLHVTPGALSSALKQALSDQVDAAVAAGRLTKQQGDALKARIAKGQTPLVPGVGYGFGGRGFKGQGFGHRGGMFGPGLAGGLFGAGYKAAASYLGITQAELQSALRSGKSLAQIATAHGKTADGLVAALVAAAKAKLDQAVAAKHLTSAQEQAILSKLPTTIKNLVDNRFAHAFDFQGHMGFKGQGFGFGHRGGVFGPGLAGGLYGAGYKAAASYLGITQAELQSALRSGKSLAQIATAHGKTADGLVAALVAAAKAKLDQAVAAKHLTSAQEQAILSKLPTTIKNLVNGIHTFGGRGDHGFGFGFGSRAHARSGAPGGTPSSSWSASLPSAQL